MKIDDLPWSSMRLPSMAAVSSLVLAWLTSALLDPIYMLDRAAVTLARLLTVAIIMTVGYCVAELFRSRAWSMIAVLRVGALLSLSALTWLREGVPSAAPTAEFVLLSLVACLLVGLALETFRSPATGERLRQWRAQPTPRLIAVLMVIVATTTALMAAPLVAHRWDASGWMDSRSYDSFAMNILTGKIPEGNSSYMPIYQYGLALIYYLFGHFFFIQQIVNILLAVAGTVALALAVWTLFESVTAVVVAMVIAAFARQFYYAVSFTQIESWYVPLICFLLLAWARYWRAPTWTRLAWLGVTLALGINTRNQGAIFFAFFCTTPLWLHVIQWRQRLWQFMAVGSMVALSLLPWTLRNYMVEGRLSPSGSRSAMYIGVLNDRRVGLYGIRYWEGWDNVVAEFEKRYADPTERERAYVRAGWQNMTSDPAWLARAMAWRTAGYYGLLPDTMLEIAHIAPTDWRGEWRRYVFGRTTQLVLLPLSLIGLLWRRDRTSVFLLGGIVANLLILAVSATSEERISYPSLPMHILLAAGVFAERTPLTPVLPAIRWRCSTWVSAAVAIALFLVACRVWVGSRYTYRPLMEHGVAVVPSVSVDETLVELNDCVRSARVASDGLAVGQKVRARAMLSNYMLPPKFAGSVPWLPTFVSDPQREGYFFAYLLGPVATGGTGEWIGVTFVGAQVSEPLREGDAVDLAGVLLHLPAGDKQGYFVRAEAVRRLPVDSSALPPFP